VARACRWGASRRQINKQYLLFVPTTLTSEITTTQTGTFADALSHLLVREGGKVDNPKDPGGRTNQGVTQRVYNGWRTRSHLPVRDVYLIGDL
jgi:hypothetical protein